MRARTPKAGAAAIERAGERDDFLLLFDAHFSPFLRLPTASFSPLSFSLSFSLSPHLKTKKQLDRPHHPSEQGRPQRLEQPRNRLLPLQLEQGLPDAGAAGVEAGEAAEGAAEARARDVQRGRARGVEALAPRARGQQAGEGLKKEGRKGSFEKEERAAFLLLSSSPSSGAVSFEEIHLSNKFIHSLSSPCTLPSPSREGERERERDPSERAREKHIFFRALLRFHIKNGEECRCRSYTQIHEKENEEESNPLHVKKRNNQERKESQEERKHAKENKE